MSSFSLLIGKTVAKALEMGETRTLHYHLLATVCFKMSYIEQLQ